MSTASLWVLDVKVLRLKEASLATAVNLAIASAVLTLRCFDWEVAGVGVENEDEVVEVASSHEIRVIPLGRGEPGGWRNCREFDCFRRIRRVLRYKLLVTRGWVEW